MTVLKTVTVKCVLGMNIEGLVHCWWKGKNTVIVMYYIENDAVMVITSINTEQSSNLHFEYPPSLSY